MRVVLQRVSKAMVEVDKQVIGAIEKGFLLLVGFTHEDDDQTIKAMVHKIMHIRLFEDEEGKMNQSLLQQNGAILSIPQFTLYADTSKGRRPNFIKAAAPVVATALYASFNQALTNQGISLQTGMFGASMQVSLTNDGPVTIVLDSHDFANKK